MSKFAKSCEKFLSEEAKFIAFSNLFVDFNV